MFIKKIFMKTNFGQQVEFGFYQCLYRDNVVTLQKQDLKMGHVQKSNEL